jgi:hypothetical protein
MAWHDVIEAPALRAQPSPLESARFGCSVERLTVSAAAGTPLAAVREAVRCSDADVVVLRYPAEHIAWFAALACHGRTAVFADSLVYWRLRAGTGRAPAPSPELEVAPAPGAAAVTELVADIFSAYGSHYLANPLFDPARALAGYQDWALRSAAGEGCLALRQANGDGANHGADHGADGLVALATLQEDAVRTEILLAGVVSARQGRGLYAHLLKAVEDRTLARDAAEVVISTQGHNSRVQRAWARYGFEPVQTVLTAHLIRSSLLPGRG